MPPRVDIIKKMKYIVDIVACSFPCLPNFRSVLYKKYPAVAAAAIDMMYQALMLLSQKGIKNKA
jgi:hypothetical protein